MKSKDSGPNFKKYNMHIMRVLGEERKEKNI